MKLNISKIKKYNKSAGKQPVMVRVGNNWYNWYEGDKSGVFLTSQDGKDVEFSYDQIDDIQESVMKLTKSKLKEMVREVINEKTNYIGPFVFSDRTDKEELLDVVAGAVDGYSNYTSGMQHKKSDYKKAYQEAEKILKKVHGMSGNEINRETRNR